MCEAVTPDLSFVVSPVVVEMVGGTVIRMDERESRT